MLRGILCNLLLWEMVEVQMLEKRAGNQNEKIGLKSGSYWNQHAYILISPMINKRFPDYARKNDDMENCCLFL